MRRAQLQHVILEIGERFGLTEFYVVGSAAILASLPDPPDGALVATRDVDVIPGGDDESIADRISYVMGEASEFDETYGYYAQGVTSSTPRYAPRGWQSRTIPIQVGNHRALCMEPHDLLLSKLGAGREKDLEFARATVLSVPVQRDELLARLADVAAVPALRRLMEDRIRALFA
jgi:hypothetical protein